MRVQTGGAFTFLRLVPSYSPAAAKDGRLGCGSISRGPCCLPIAENLAELRVAIPKDIEDMLERIKDLESQRTKKAAQLIDVLRQTASPISKPTPRNGKTSHDGDSLACRQKM